MSTPTRHLPRVLTNTVAAAILATGAMLGLAAPASAAGDPPTPTAAAVASAELAATGTTTLPAPTLTVAPNVDLDPAGATLIVEGHDYRRSEAGSGFALRFGWIADVWKPTDGAANSARPSITFTSVSSAPDDDANVQWAENADGTVDFTWTVEVDRQAADAKRPGDDYRLGVFTFGNKATQGLQPDNEHFVPVSWRVPSQPQPEPSKDPRITVTPSADLDPSTEHTLTVSGSGYLGDSAINGVYVLLGRQDVWSGGGALPSEGWVQTAWVPARSISGGSFTTSLTVPAGSLDTTKRYHVATSAAHALSITDRSLDAFAEVTVARASEPSVRSVVFTAGSSVAQGGLLEVGGSGFATGDVVTAVAHSEPVTIGTATADAAGRVLFQWTVPTTFAAGEHLLELVVRSESVAAGRFTVTPLATSGDEHGSEATPSQAADRIDRGTDSSTLAVTGGGTPIITLWVGAGSLLFGALTVSITRRREAWSPTASQALWVAGSRRVGPQVSCLLGMVGSAR